MKISAKWFSATAMALALPAAASAQTEVNIVAFAPGFAWADMFGASGTEKTDKLRAFEEANDIVINIEFADEDTARQKVLLDLVNQTGTYDLVMLGSDGAVQTFSYAGYLEPLDDLLPTAAEYFDPDAVYPQFLEANTVNGQLWALPYYSFGAGAVYRTDIFERYGITEFPETTEGLEEALETIKAGLEADGIDDVYPLTMRGAPGEEPSLDLNGFVYAYAGYPAWFEGGAVTPEEIRETDAKPIFTGDFRDGFEAFVRWSRDYGPDGIATHTWVDMMNLYGAGQAAVLLPSAINGFAALGGSENEDVVNNTAFAPAPVGPSGKPLQSFWTFSVGVSAFSDNKEEAFKTLAFLTGEQAMQGFAESIGWPYSTFPSITNGETLAAKWPAEMLAEIEASYEAADPQYFPYIPELNAFMERIGTEASAAISGSKTVDEALDDLQSWAEERMERGGYYD
ncbi:probable sorbitol-binding periplasmic protein [Oceanicola granulosus HTCC2516]|uniref:Probable sorbitol-binding periplasmic protein n=1 Tax=Oceanicola granulosus (strain ATCC BAA-861 / DSM 15982 / KCTC 12143 / HTCC2516) TaxID=314256 RepID=Q2CEP7_OCEGH|nr:extracellular solute-binding protein [Oceanicola granulosus]EAR51085.1 probable sorbitol-binding periplasmic protein [Oceanicola granulosus HTCC2516]